MVDKMSQLCDLAAAQIVGGGILSKRGLQVMKEGHGFGW